MTQVTAFYSRAGLNVETYDARMAADSVLFADDRPVWRALAGETGGPVLDLGTGTGRVAIDLARRGLRVTGVDNAPAMLAAAQARRAALPDAVAARLTFIAGDMAALDAPGKGGFALALAPHRAFQLMPDPASGAALLAGVRDHLRPGGRFAFDLLDARPDGGGDESESELPGVRNPHSGRFVRIFAGHRRLSNDRRLVSETWRFVETDAGGVPVREESERLVLRWTPAPELAGMLAASGLRVIAYRPGFGAERAAPHDRDRAQFWLCERPVA